MICLPASALYIMYDNLISHIRQMEGMSMMPSVFVTIVNAHLSTSYEVFFMFSLIIYFQEVYFQSNFLYNHITIFFIIIII